MKKVCVDESKCIGCGACVAIAPENFDFNEDGYSTVINEIPNEKVQDAIEACPVFAISIEDIQENKKDNVCSNNTNNCDDSCECDDCNCDDDGECCHECNCCHDSVEQDNEDEAA